MKTTTRWMFNFFGIIGLVLIVACAGLQFGGDNSVATQVLVSIATRNIACEIATMDDPEVVRTIVNLYESLKSGTVSDDALAQLSDLTASRPTLGADIIDLIALLGVQFDAGSGLVSGVEGLDPVLFETVEKAWNQGMSMCRVL